jgi:hypothetical protein
MFAMTYVPENDPLGLFDDEQPVAIEASPASPKTPFSIWLLGAALAGICALSLGQLAIDRGLFGGSQKDGGSDVRPAVAVKTLIFLHERNPQPIEHDLLLREMPTFCADRNIQFRVLDDDVTDEPVPSLLSWAKSKGVLPPLVIATDGSDKPAKAMAWPSSIEKLEAFTR